MSWRGKKNIVIYLLKINLVRIKNIIIYNKHKIGKNNKIEQESTFMSWRGKKKKIVVIHLLINNLFSWVEEVSVKKNTVVYLLINNLFSWFDEVRIKKYCYLFFN